MYPSGIMYLASYLRRHDISVEILDASVTNKCIPLPEREQLLIKTILAKKPRIIGFSASHLEYEEVSRINKTIQDKDNSILSIVGGSQPTYRCDDFIQSGFKFIAIGEGEKTLYRFVTESRKEKPDWSSVDGLVWKSDGATIKNPPCTPMTESEINDNFLPAYDLIDKRYFDFNAGLIRGFMIRGAMLLTTRGCPFKCSFCGCNLIFGKKLRFKSIDKIEEEILYLKSNFGVEGVWIIDDTFTVNKKHIANVCALFKKHKLIWGCQSRVDTLDEETVRIMKDSGCVQIDFGVESGSQRILDEIIQKGTTIPQIKKAFALARKYKLRTLANFMIALPTETLDDFKKTKTLAQEINADVYIFSIATPLPGTRLYDMVGVPISPQEYSTLNWEGSTLTKRLNNSEIPDAVSARVKLHKKYYLKSLLKSFFSLSNITFFFTHGSKLKRLMGAKRYINKFLNFKIPQ
jgi:radical SAM superfamily enzyme YgiQ (UPF0313 family)